MSKIKTGFIGISSAVISLFVAFFNYRGFENFSGIVRLVAIVLSALVIGMCQGFLSNARSIEPWAWAHFSAC